MTDKPFNPTHAGQFGTPVEIHPDADPNKAFVQVRSESMDWFATRWANLAPLVEPEETPGETPEDVEREEESLRVAAAQAYIRCDNSRIALMEAVTAAMSLIDQGQYNSARAILEVGRTTAKAIMIPTAGTK